MDKFILKIKRKKNGEERTFFVNGVTTEQLAASVFNQSIVAADYDILHIAQVPDPTLRETTRQRERKVW